MRSHIGPFFGWLSAELPLYPSAENPKTRAHLRDNGIRLFVELEPTDQPLAIEQRDRIPVARVAEIYAHLVHGHKRHRHGRGPADPAKVRSDRPKQKRRLPEGKRRFV